jgi:hypothetical protein
VLIGCTTVAVADGAGLTGAQHVAAVFALAVAGALALGGALLACAEATGGIRLAVLVGLVSGITVGPLATASVLDKVGWHPADADGLGVVWWVPALLLVLVATVKNRRGDPGEHGWIASRPRWWTGWTVLLVAALAAVVVIGDIAQRVLTAKLLDAPGGRSQRRVDLATAVDQLVPYAIGAVVLVVLLWYAARRGGASLVRWVLTGLALALAAPLALPVDLLARRTAGLGLVILGVLAAVVGVFLARRAPRAAPWEALGVLVAAAALLLFGRAFRNDLHSAMTAQSALLVLGLGVALGAGLTSVLHPDDPEPDPRLTPALIADRAALAFVGLSLGAWVVLPVALEPLTYRPEGSSVPTGPVIMAVLAVVSVLVFAVDRLLERTRASMLAQARRELFVARSASRPAPAAEEWEDEAEPEDAPGTERPQPPEPSVEYVVTEPDAIVKG